MKKNDVSMPKIELSQIRLNRQGYTSNGRYYGGGAPVFQAHNTRNHETLEFRAADRATAKKIVGQLFTDPKATSLANQSEGQAEEEEADPLLTALRASAAVSAARRRRATGTLFPRSVQAS